MCQERTNGVLRVTRFNEPRTSPLKHNFAKHAQTAAAVDTAELEMFKWVEDGTKIWKE